MAERVLRGSLVPGPLAEDPAKVKHELARWIQRVDDEDRLKRRRRSGFQGDRAGEGRPRYTARPRGELRAKGGALPRPESRPDLRQPTRGFVIAPTLREWRLAREAERAEGADSADPPGSASVPPDPLSA